MHQANVASSQPATVTSVAASVLSNTGGSQNKTNKRVLPQSVAKQPEATKKKGESESAAKDEEEEHNKMREREEEKRKRRETIFGI
ncbi:hypothetical protein QL285_081690 [Trifolium repens]|nr:hypothetical protein QL285_081690 [Trifolium repens]